MKVAKTLNVSSLRLLNVRRSLGSEWRQLKKGKKKASLSSPKTNYALYKRLGTRTSFPEMYDNRACTHEFSITRFIFKPRLILRFGIIVLVSGIGTTRTKRDNQCGIH